MQEHLYQYMILRGMLTCKIKTDESYILYEQ